MASRVRKSRATLEAVRASRRAADRWPGVSIPIDDCDGRYYFDRQEADRATEFFPEFLRHQRGPLQGQPIELMDYQRELIVRPLFGWKRRSDDRRRFRKVWLEVPKKNAKSILASGLGVYLLLCDREKGAEIYCTAADREQARVVYDTARGMVQDSEDMSRMCKPWSRVIEVPGSKSFFKVLSSDAKTKHGPNIHGLIFDEIHAFPARTLHDVLVRGIVARWQPVVLYTTTAGVDEESIAKELHDYAAGVIAGTILDETWLPVIFGAKTSDDWEDEELWWRVNPGMGISVSLESLQEAHREAQYNPGQQNSFMQLHTNMWTQQAEAWIPLKLWDRCMIAELEPVVADGVAGGLDLSSKIDLTSFSVLVMHRDPPSRKPDEVKITGTNLRTRERFERSLSLNFTLDVHTWFWMPEDSIIERSEQDRKPFEQWRDEGHLKVTSGAIIDQDQILEEIVVEISPPFSLKSGQIGHDPHNAGQFAIHLEQEGFTVVEVPQTVLGMSESAKIWFALIKAGRLRHNGNPVMRWNIGNVAAKEDKKENIFPYKPKKTKRIDGVIGAIIALSRLLAEPDTGPSMYESEQPMWLDFGGGATP